MSPETWAKRMLLAELRDLKLMGYACNVDRHSAALQAADKKRRAEARRLLRVAIAAVRK